MNTLLLGNTKKDIKEAAQLIRDGQVVAIPTETVYGLAADALNPQAVKKIFESKGRPMDNPLIVHISDVSDIDKFNLVSEIPDKAKILMDNFWPGPLTIILKKTDVIPNEVSAGLDTVALRLPANSVAREIISNSGTVAAAPSANRSGSPSPTTAQHVYADMDGIIPAIVDAGQSDVGVESTVISLATDTPRLLRPGYITVEQIQQLIGKIDVDKAVLYQLEDGQKASSPGMKYKHYSPDVKVVLLKGSSTDFVRYVNDKFDSDSSVCAICFDEETSQIKAHSIAIGREKDLDAQAHNLFDALRKVDALSDITVAYAHCPSTDGVSMALYNRLIRAAGFEVVDLHSAFVVGLTGKSGAGKGEVAEIFLQYGYKYIDADVFARKAVEKGSETLHQLSIAFSKDILNSDGTLNRAKLAEVAFYSKENTQTLNSIIHPAIIRLIKDEINRLNNSSGAKIVYDAPTLFESKSDNLCDVIVSVVADTDIRLDRIIKRDKITLDMARVRMSAQADDSFYTDRSDYVIENKSDLLSLKESVKKVIFDIEKVHNGTL